MGELLPFLLGGAAGLMLGRRSARLTIVVAFALGVAASATNGELIAIYAPVFILIDTALAWFGYTAAVAVVWRLRRAPRN
jgi:hypothetical protein